MEMMNRFKEHKHYSRNFKLGLILSELLIICAFLFSPGIRDSQFHEINEPLILFEDIPVTVQQNIFSSVPPKVPEIIIAENISDPIILDDIMITENSRKESVTEETLKTVSNANPFPERRTPRQLLEVLPDKSKKNYNGSIQFRLKIDIYGKVAEHVILFNSLECEDCLKEIISSVYKSVWEPGISKGSQTEFWVEKSYTFN